MCQVWFAELSICLFCCRQLAAFQMRAPAVRILNVHLEKLQKRYPVPEEAIASPSIWQLLFPLFKSIALDS